MSKSVKIVIVLLVLGVMAYIVTSSIATSKLSCEVCIDFKGREACRTARGPTREEAIQTALNNACAQVVSGRTENILCGGSAPATVACSGE